MKSVKSSLRVPTPALVFGSIVTGAVLWTGLEFTVGDPFDSVAYPVLLLIVGVVSAWLNPSGTWRWAASFFFGELVAFMVSVNVGPGGPFGALGVLFLIYYAFYPWIAGRVFVIFWGGNIPSTPPL